MLLQGLGSALPAPVSFLRNFSEACVWSTTRRRNREGYNLNICSNVSREGRMRAFANVFDSVFCLRLFQ
jgi:hypothetical protein